jgi:hypothetical protein
VTGSDASGASGARGRASAGVGPSACAGRRIHAHGAAAPRSRGSSRAPDSPASVSSIGQLV